MRTRGPERAGLFSPLVSALNGHVGLVSVTGINVRVSLVDLSLLFSMWITPVCSGGNLQSKCVNFMFKIKDSEARCTIYLETGDGFFLLTQTVLDS